VSVWEAEGAVDRLRELYAVKPPLSAVQIADALSKDFAPVSRSAVIGKISRLGLTRDAHPPAGLEPGTEKARQHVLKAVAISVQVRRERAQQRAAETGVPFRPKPKAKPRAVMAVQTKSDIRREFEEAWANTAKLRVA
jgi:hypothetical protein